MNRAVWYIGATVAILGGLVALRFRQEATSAEGQAKGGGGAPAGGPPGGGGGPGGGSRASTVEVAEAGPAKIQTILETVGTLESRDRAELAPRTTARILMLTVREGDRVNAGQLLVRLDPAEIEGQVSQARSDVAEARARLAQAQLGQNPNQVSIQGAIAQQVAAVESARAEFEQAKQTVDAQIAVAQAALDSARARVKGAEADKDAAQARQNREEKNQTNAENRAKRTEELLAQGFASQQQAEDARTAAEVARGNFEVAQSDVRSAAEDVAAANTTVTSAERQLQIARKRTEADLRAARARLNQAEAALRTARANSSQTGAYAQNLAALRASVNAAEARLRQAESRRAETELRAPFSGVVTARRGDPGSLASPGASVLSVQGASTPQVRISIPAANAGAVFVGQSAEMTLDGVKDRTFRGRISNLNAAADPVSRQISALVQLEAGDSVLRPGLFGKVAIVIDSVDASVAVPREAVRSGREGATVAVVGAENKAEVRPVKLGIQDGKRVQILEGVKAGEKVVTLSFTPVRDGQTLQLPGQRGGSRGGQGGPSVEQKGGGRP
jgi:HlyD family secretion protein